MLFYRRRVIILAVCLLLAVFAACGAARRNRSGGKRRRQNVAQTKPQPSDGAVRTSAGNRTSDPAVAVESDPSLPSALPAPDAAATEPNADKPPAKKSKNSRRKRKRGKKSGKGKRKGKKRGGKRRRKNRKSGGTGSAGKLRATMKKIFGFDHMMSPRPTWSRRSRLDAEVGEDDEEEEEDLALHPPEFMLELYRILSQDRSMMHYHFESQGNTVRSFFSVAVNRPDGRRKGMGRPITITSLDAPPSSDLASSYLGGASTGSRSQAMKVFAFNVTTIPGDEAVVSAELRLDSDAQSGGTGRAGNASDWTVFVGVYRLTEGDSRSPKVHRRVGQPVQLNPGSSSFWTSPGLGEAVAASTQPGHILIARFHDRPDLSRTARDLAASQNPQAAVSGNVPTLPESFTVADSERSKRNSGGQPTPSRPDADFDLPPRIPFLIVYCNDSKTVPRPTPAARLVYESLLSDSRKRRSQRRVRRSSKRLRDPESEGETDTTDGNEFPENESSSSQQTAQGADAGESSSLSNRRTEPPASSVMATLKPRKASKRKGRKSKSKSKSRRCKRRGKKGKKRCKPKKSTTPKTEPNASSGACGRKEMLVNFEELGWQHWIVAPHTMQLYYCTGGCEHGSMQDPTNHAIIQSLIKSLGFNTEVANPCCVPSKLSPVSMLYFDESELLVLKSYPDMEVNSCACR